MCCIDRTCLFLDASGMSWLVLDTYLIINPFVDGDIE